MLFAEAGVVLFAEAGAVLFAGAITVLFAGADVILTDARAILQDPCPELRDEHPISPDSMSHQTATGQ